jgi:hypothetical protein
MKKIIFHTIFMVSTLSGCAHLKTEDPKVEYRKAYALYSCPQLCVEQTNLEEKLEQEENRRGVVNTVNAVVGVLSILKGGGSMSYNGMGEAEKELHDRLLIVKALSLEKKCEGGDFH